MTATAIAVATAVPGAALTVSPTTAVTSMSIAPLKHGQRGVLQFKNADSTHAVSVIFAAGTGPSAAVAPLTVSAAANTTSYISLPETGSYGDAGGLLQLTLTPASGGALTSSTAVVLAGSF